MNSGYLREQKRYTQEELIQIFNCSKDKAILIIRKLKEYGILKVVKASATQKDMTELVDCNIEVADVELGNENYYYVCTFVGIITVAGCILKCYPKYIINNDSPILELKQILKVIEKYNYREQIIKIFNDTNHEQSFNLLAVFLFLINDYYENGIYTNTETIVESNGTGEILWEKTVNETFAILTNNRPYYTELKTIKSVNDNDYYIKRLHECIVTTASKELEKHDVLNLFDITPIDISEEKLDDFGDDNYILYRIEKELNQQFNTRKQILLKIMYAYVCNRCGIQDIECFSMFGTNSFNLIWEKVCATIMRNNLYTELNKLDLPVALNEKYKHQYNQPLISLIDKPFWSITNKPASDTLIPDIITIQKIQNIYNFIILDAKYYVPKLELNVEPTSQPGIESITKQYLYQLAYKPFIEEHKITKISNYFIMPTEDNNIIDKGFVELQMLKNIGLESIKVRLLPASKIYQYYLNNEYYDISEFDIEYAV